MDANPRRSASNCMGRRGLVNETSTASEASPAPATPAASLKLPMAPLFSCYVFASSFQGSHHETDLDNRSGGGRSGRRLRGHFQARLGDEPVPLRRRGGG